MVDPAAAPWRWRAHVAEAMARLAVASLLIRLLPLRWWRRWLGGTAPPPADRAGPASAAALFLAQSVKRGAARLPLDTKCLPRAIALHTMLRRRGLPSRLVIAVLDPRRRGTVDDLHAWVESAGEILIGETEAPFHPVVTYV